MDTTKALTIINEHKGKDLVFVDPNELETGRMFYPQVSVINATPQDFHNIKGRMMPKSYHTDRIGEAAGIEFVASECGTRKEGDNVWVGFAQGRRRLPDGTFRTSTKQEYEYDVDVRSEEDFANDTKGTYNTEAAKRKHVIELKKYARQKASTGARLRVIRELTGIPAAFTQQDIQRALVVARIAVNTDELLDNPDTRKMAVAAAMNKSNDIYGVRDVSNSEQLAITEGNGDEPEASEATDISEATEEADDFDDVTSSAGEGDELSPLMLQLEEWSNNDIIRSSKTAMSLINDLTNKKAVTRKELEDAIARCRDYYNKKSGGKS